MKELLKKITPTFLIRLKWRVGSLFSGIIPTAKGLSKETGIPYLILLLDMGMSALRYTAAPHEYKMYHFYERSHWSRSRFLTEFWNNTKVCPFFNPEEHRSLLVNKDDFNRHFSEFLHREWLYAPDASDQQIEDFLREQKHVIVKPRDLNWGRGVYKLSYSEVSNMKTFCESARKEEYLLEEVIQQHPDLHSINSASVNTLRVCTMLDKEGVLHILFAGLRMGRGESVVDNMNSGGIAAQIDLDSGVVCTPGVGKDLQPHIKHPTSGIVILGFQIPHWETVKTMVLRAATMAPQNRWIAWDVAITEKGPLLVEGNASPGTDVMQLSSQTGFLPTLRSYL